MTGPSIPCNTARWRTAARTLFTRGRLFRSVRSQCEVNIGGRRQQLCQRDAVLDCHCSALSELRCKCVGRMLRVPSEKPRSTQPSDCSRLTIVLE